ncbi:MAG: FkbM family methyltransferase [Thermoanaerobaculia bacterium]|nr:FkbM family methyltransferase [Thermoanaerobaculia bacterium]
MTQMKSFFRKTLTQMFPETTVRYRAYKNLIGNKDSYLYLSGWMQSLGADKPINKDGRPVPWMNYSVVLFLEERLTPDLTLFEYGSGYSTFFYADRVRSVVSVEYDKKWFDLITSKAPKNASLMLKEKDVDGDYCRVIGTTHDSYDVVVVDGRDRVNCVKQSIPALSDRGVILLDDSKRPRYEEAISFALERGFKTLHFEGLQATGSGVKRTTILYRNSNCFGI